MHGPVIPPAERDPRLGAGGDRGNLRAWGEFSGLKVIIHALVQFMSQEQRLDVEGEIRSRSGPGLMEAQLC